MKLNYKNIKEMLDGDLFGAGISEDGKHIILEFAGNDEYDTPIYKATWESKRNAETIWYVVHYYYSDGMVEELFEHEKISA